jgi:hypothetical protein
MTKNTTTRINKRSLFLRDTAQMVCDELAVHPVLRQYWGDLSVILKGSTARGNADRLSDIDLVLYCDEQIRKAIVEGYRAANLTQRKDGIFMFFAGKDYDGHYHVETFDQLERYYSLPDFIHLWEYQSAIALHDPAHHFNKIVSSGAYKALNHPLSHIKRAYLDLQLDLDWMRHPLKRGDELAVYLHCAQITRGLIRISYLLDGKPYPPDKWAAYYLNTTRFGKRQRAHLNAYAIRSVSGQNMPRYLDLIRYPLYTDAQKMIDQLRRFICRHYGNLPWLNEWYKYV